MKKEIKKVLILGSGALKIGEAGEFDYSGSQAIKALKEEGIKTILVNPNIATIQTSSLLADEVYFLPVTSLFVEKVIAKEKPDAIMLSFGGQTALNCGIDLEEKGILQKYNVAVLGTPVSSIILTEDRKKFAEHLTAIHIPTPQSKLATSLESAVAIVEELGFPVMIRAGFALGGQGSGIATSMEQFKDIVQKALTIAPQVLVEQYLHHYKEIEYEVVRDQYDNCITVCNMENMDPLGIHTGESIVIAPSQTLTNTEYHTLRSASIAIVRSLGVVGECNVQFAVNPKTFAYYVIEVNARLSRSSALASKATGYPLAYVAAKIVLGKGLFYIKNRVTGVTSACFEPSLDYVVVKIPRWDLDKFRNADHRIGTSMKSVGEVMGIGRTFEEAYQKALRMLDLNFEGAVCESLFSKKTEIAKELKFPTPKRCFAIAQAFKQGLSVRTIHNLTGINVWFLYRIAHIVQTEQAIKDAPVLSEKILRHAKEIGCSDKRIGELVGKTGLQIRSIRKQQNIFPAIFQIDTLAAEFPAQTNYLYMTYNGSHNDIQPCGRDGVIVLGSGPYRIGSSVEFDWTSVNTVQALKKHHKQSIVINCNPETVSTDYDVSDRLYFEELTFERITDIYEFEDPLGIIVSVGGQTPNNRAPALKKYGVRILGTDPDDIDRAEDRNKFSYLLDTLGIEQAPWDSFSSLEKAESFANRVGYPVLVRPSYVLSGSAMNICYTKEDLATYISQATKISQEYPVIISKFMQKVKEIEVDAVGKEGVVKALAVSEHVENAGVHSGDASIIFPSQTINQETRKKMEDITYKLVKALHITGPVNIQFLAKNNDVYVIETNLRASRTFPFISKVLNKNLMELFVDCLFQKEVQPIPFTHLPFVAVKVPQFSFSRLSGADPLLRVEMASTGEVACFGKDKEEAFLKGMLAVGVPIPKKGILITIGNLEKKKAFIASAKLLKNFNVPLYATEKTAALFAKQGIEATVLHKIYEQKSPNPLEYIKEKKIDLVINIVDHELKKNVRDGYLIRQFASANNITVLTKIKKANLFIQAITTKTLDDLEIRSWKEYTHSL